MKKKNRMNSKLPSIGAIVRKIMKEKKLTERKVATAAGWNPSTVSHLLHRNDWRVSELMLMSEILETDLFIYYYPVLPVPQVPLSELTAAHQEIENLKAELKSREVELLKLSTENNVLREVFGK